MHVIGDKRAGGSNIYVKRLVNSHLQKQFSFSVGRLEEIKPQIKDFQPDLIVFHYPCAWKYLPDLLWLKQYGKVAIADHHYCRGFEQHQVSSLFRFRLMLSFAYGLADFIIAVSEAQRQWMIENKLVNPKKIRVISGAAPIEDFLKINTTLPNNHDPLTIGAYGRFAPQKGFDILLEAFAKIDKNRFKLRLAGYGQDEAKITALANPLTNVELLGAIKNVPAFLANCDVIAIPSRWESWGLVCMEAKAAGKPIITSGIDGLGEQLKDCGLLVTSNSVDGWKNGIASLIEKPLAKWGEIGRASVINAWDDFLNNWCNFLQEVAQ